MNNPPDNATLLDRLAAEYVLGTLRGAARTRFARWRNLSVQVDDYCRFWEAQLMPLLHGVRPLRPPALVWRRIQQRLKLSSATQRPTPWRALAFAASILLVLGLGTLLYWRTIGAEHPARIAAIAAPSGAPLWLVEVYGEAGTAGKLTVRAGALAAPPSGRDYELWALPKGGAPVSLGVLPYRERTAQRALSTVQQSALERAAQVAVSVEPPGGSATGAPTGPVVYVVTLRAAG